MCWNEDQRMRLTMGLRFSTRWMPTIPRNAPKLSWRYKKIAPCHNHTVFEGLIWLNSQCKDCEGERGCDGHSQWCQSNIQQQARCLCEWQRSDPQPAPPEPEPAETPSPTELFSFCAGSDLRRDDRRNSLHSLRPEPSELHAETYFLLKTHAHIEIISQYSSLISF